MALSNSQYNAVMRGYEERQRLQRRAGFGKYTAKYRRFRSWTASSVQGPQTVPDGCWAETQGPGNI